MIRSFLPFFALLLTGAQAPAGSDRTQWRVAVADDGAVVGTISETRSPDGRESIVTQRFTVQERGDSPTRIVERTVTRYDAAGRVAVIEREQQAGRTRSWAEARIVGDRVRVTRRSGSAPPVVTTLVLPPGTRFDSGQGLLATWRPASEAELSFDNFNLEAGAVERVVIAPAAPPPGVPAGHRALLRRRYEEGSLRAVHLLILDPQGRLVETHQPMFGSTLIVRRASREEAERPTRPHRPLDGALMRSPFRIPAGALAGRIRYRFSFRDNLAFPLPETGDQRTTTSGNETILDVCADCGNGLPATPEALAAARRPTAWLQSDHPRLRTLAASVGPANRSQAATMAALVRVVEQRIEEIDFAGHFTALDTLDRRRGDCTESAVLLAALGRAAGIPTKVASGLVYSRERYHGRSNIFMPHAWVLAYVDGRWRSFDAALGGFDASHIALTIGDGDARSIAAANQLAGLIVWQGMQEVRRRPAG